MTFFGRSRNCPAWIAFVLALLFAGNAQAQIAKSDNDSRSETVPAIDRIHPGDLIEIDVLGGVDYDWRGRLNPEGFLESFQIGEKRIVAVCLSPDELAREVESSLTSILRTPQVVVRILDRSGRPQTLMFGAIRTPQRFQIRRNVKLNELIVNAGGLTDQLSGSIRIFRPANQACRDAKDAAGSRDNEPTFYDINISELLQGKESANLTVLAGDIITIGEAFPVFVVGGVNNPRPVMFRDEMTLTRAIASAGGLSRDAVSRDVLIFRRSNGKSSVIEADLEKIKSKAVDDIKLEKFDIVDIGRKGRERRQVPTNDLDPGNRNADVSKMPLRVID
jgi:protein involved in polysaccharide export with SLBB domain